MRGHLNVGCRRGDRRFDHRFEGPVFVGDETAERISGLAVADRRDFVPQAVNGGVRLHEHDGRLPTRVREGKVLVARHGVSLIWIKGDECEMPTGTAALSSGFVTT